MSAALLASLVVVFGAVQVIAWFAVGRNLWPFLRRHAAPLLSYRGVPYFVGTALLVVVTPCALLVAALVAFGFASPPVVALWLRHFWIPGLLFGLTACVLYYGPKDLAARQLRKGAHPRTNEQDGA